MFFRINIGEIVQYWDKNVVLLVPAEIQGEIPRIVDLLSIAAFVAQSTHRKF